MVNSPGPIMSDLGNEHVPMVLMPSLYSMKMLLFPAALVVAESVVALGLNSPFPNGAFLHIREERTSSVRPEIFDPAHVKTQMEKTRQVLRTEKYAIAMAHLDDPSLILIREDGVTNTLTT